MRTPAHPLRKRATRGGLTLLEMVVVLVILVALAGVAIQSAQGLADQGRYEATRRTLTHADDAVAGREGEREPDGSARITGFVADLGRQPVVIDDGGVATAGELLSNVSGLADYALRAIPTVAYADPGDPLHAAFTVDATAFPVGCGWRGPYLRLRVGASDLRDGWGSAFDLLDAAEGVLTDADAGAAIAALRSNGSDGDDTTTTSTDDAPYIGNLEVVWRRTATGVDRVTAAVAGKVSVRSASGSGTLEDPTAATDLVIVLLYGPDPTTGKVLITHAGGSVSVGDASSVTLGDTAAVAAPWTYSLATTTGPRAIRAYVHRAGVTYASPLVRLAVPAGGITRDLVVEVP